MLIHRSVQGDYVGGFLVSINTHTGKRAVTTPFTGPRVPARLFRFLRPWATRLKNRPVFARARAEAKAGQAVNLS
jgi:hypothetical protein